MKSTDIPLWLHMAQLHSSQCLEKFFMLFGLFYILLQLQTLVVVLFFPAVCEIDQSTLLHNS